LNKYKYTVEFR